jgi:parallel beta-helix repeat protein
MRWLSILVIFLVSSMTAIAEQPAPINGTCGIAQGDSTMTSPPPSDLCNTGSASSVSGGDGSTWIWTCHGNGPHHTNASCSAPFATSTVDGQCGSANGVASCTAPNGSLCSSGTATAVSGLGNGPWVWSCTGSGGGMTATCTAPAGTNCGGGTTQGQVPGPSADLFNNPYYKCNTNYYVSTGGNDSGTGLQGSPWRTLQRADTAKVSAGSCINVAPGTYSGFTVVNGGNAATSTGYVVYRCQTMDACIITGNGGVNGSSSVETDASHAVVGGPNSVNYLQFDGFELVGTSNQFHSIGFSVFADNGGAQVASHHVWLLNSIVHGFGQSGIAMNEGDYYYVIHNTFYGNSNVQCDSQGSGFSAWHNHPIPGYVPTTDDRTNPNSLLGPTWQIGGSFFHIVVEYNVAYNNAMLQCGTTSNPYNTDGNGMIFDQISSSSGNPTPYTNPILAAFNVVYNNGGGGVHVNGSDNVTVANNTCYNNYLDPADQATWRGCIDDNGGSNNSYINNISVSIQTQSTNCSVTPPFTKFNNSILDGSNTSGDTFSNNLTNKIGVGCQDEVSIQSGSAYNIPPNIHANPNWFDVGTSSIGTMTTQPVGHNFALSPGSPAIGAGLTETYLPAQSVDLGACASALTICP